MSLFYSHVNTAKALLTNYAGNVPFSIYLKGFFAANKKYGSRDRKAISSLCYNYFRLGKGLQEESLQEKMLVSVFLSNNAPNPWLESEKPEWNFAVTKPLLEKLALAHLYVQTIFPFNNELSPEIDKAAFNLSFLIQPNVFIRIRPGKHSVVKKKLLTAEIVFEEISEHCLAFANGTKLEHVLEINKEAVIQDYNSQRIGEYFPVRELQKAVTVWDCCAASGGKSLLCFDLLHDIKLSASDVRPSIIHNLQKRFKQAGLKNFTAFVCDVTSNESVASSLANTTFDLVICDAPCSGSGTWARTPEQLLLFKHEEINRYCNLQISIAENAVKHVRKGGFFVYITCSVFTKENEEVVALIRQRTKLNVIKMEYLKGYNVKADTMFAALFKSDG